MKLAKALGTALSAGLGAAGEVAQAQDKSEQELSKVLVANRIKEFQKIKEDAAETVKDIRKRENEIDVFHGQVVGRDGATDQERLLSRNEIGQLIDTHGKDFLVDYITSGESSLRVFGEAKKIEGKPFDASSLLTDKQDLEAAVPEGKGIASGQSKRVVERVERQLAELGYSTGIKVPVQPVYTGGIFKFEQTPDLDTKTETVYETDEKGVPTRTLLKTTTINKKDASVQVNYVDSATMEPVQPASSSRLFDNAAMAKLLDSDPANPISKNGFLAFVDKDNQMQLIPAPGGGFQGGARMKDGSIRASVGGTLADTPYVPPEGAGYITVVDPTDFQDPEAWTSLTRGNKAVTGTPGIEEFRKTREEALVSKQNLSALKDTVDFRLGLHATYGDDLYSISGGFASAVSGVSNLVDSTASVIERVIAAETPQEKMRELRMNESVLRQALTDKDTILAKVAGTEKEIATARVLDIAAAQMMAYDKGKTKGEDRLTDNDFNIFFGTVRSTSAAKTIALIESTYREAVSQYAPLYDRLQSDLRFATDVLKSQIDDEEQVNTIMTPYVNRANEFTSPDTLLNELDAKLEEVRGGVAQTEEALGKTTGPAVTFNSAKSSNVTLKIRGDTVSFEVDGKPSSTTLSLEDARDLGHLSETDYQKAKASQQKAQ